MNGILIACLILLPMLASPAGISAAALQQSVEKPVCPTLPLIELACAVALILFPDAQLTLPGVCGLGLHFAAGSLRTLLTVTACFLWAMTGLNSPAYFCPCRGLQPVLLLLAADPGRPDGGVPGGGPLYPVCLFRDDVLHFLCLGGPERDVRRPSEPEKRILRWR